MVPDKEKFFPNFRIHVIDLNLIHPRVGDAPSDFVYPNDCLLGLRDILSDQEILCFNNVDHSDEPVPSSAALRRSQRSSAPFSKSGDSGAIIVDARRKFAALLTGSLGPADVDALLWNDYIKHEFPCVNLCFEA
ncbi:hypothetical protein C8Q78DRAFT_1077595 [Trametes maxima]|nr:hypothetical protein C8Q78DRAFT_1077595 [Trametes maxima]